MRYKILAGTDLNVSAVCLGGGSYGDKVNKEDAFLQLDRFFEAGGNFIDTANVYCRWVAGENCSEEIIGEWLRSRGKRQTAIVATKGAHYDLKRPDVPRVNREAVRTDLEESLRTLGLECIPFYWLHRDDPKRPVEEIIDFCEDFRKEGKIRYYGVSNWTAERVSEAAAYAKEKGYSGIRAVSNQYSLAFLDREKRKNGDPTLVMTDPAYLKWHEETGMPLIPYTSTAGGFYAKLHELAPDVREGCLYDGNGNPDPSGDCLSLSEGGKKAYLNSVTLRRYEYMKQFGREQGLSMMDMSIGYLTGLDFQVVPAASASNLTQLEELIAAADTVLPGEAVETLRSMEF